MRTLFFNSITRFILVCIGSFLWRSALADDNDNTIKIPDFPYKSPEALSFERYGEYNVGEYSGNAQIAIPLYNIKCRDIEIPLTLTYQGNGIKVAEEASWVGLGWNLAIGGCINKISANLPDILARTVSWNDEKDFLNSTTAPNHRYKTNSLSQPISDALIYDIQNGLGEKDFYSLSLMGKNTLFMIDLDTNETTFIGSHDDLYSIVKQGNNWIVKDCLGFVYTFSERERVLSPIGEYDSAWNISNITSPTGKHVRFLYSNTSYLHLQSQIYQSYDIETKRTILAIEDLNYTPSYPSAGLITFRTNDNKECQKTYLSAILTDEDSIIFHRSSRVDLWGGQKLDSIIILSKISNRKIKGWHFLYDYFSSNNIGGSYLTSPLSSDDTNTKRLKLLSVEQDLLNNDRKTYTFEYEETYGLPSKTSYATDVWGYFNGEPNTQYIPSEKYCFMGTDVDSVFSRSIRMYKGANRFASAQYSNQCCLKRITYPTKGYTIFRYEPNTFISIPSYPDAQSDYVVDERFQCQDINYSGINSGPTTISSFSIDNIHDGILNVTFSGNPSTGTTIAELKNHGAQVHLQQINVSNPVSYTIDLSDVSYGELNYVYEYNMEKDLTLPSGDYKLIATLPDYFGHNPGLSVLGELSITSIIDDPQTFHSIGGGLRIQSIENYDSDSILIEKTDYEYVDTNGRTSGKLLVPANLAEYCIRYGFGIQHEPLGDPDIRTSGASLFEVLRYHSSPYGNPSITNTTCNGTIGYSRVVKKKKGLQGSKEISTFINVPSSPDDATERIYKYMSSNLYFNSTLSNGELTSKTIMDENGDTIAHTTYIYSNVFPTYYLYNISIEDRYTGTFAYAYSTYIDTEAYYHIPRYIINVYSYPCIWHRIATVMDANYENGIRKQVKTTSFIYDSTNYAQNHSVMEKVESSSISGVNYVTKYEYPVTLTDNISTGMTAKHMWNNIISESVYENERLIKKSKTQYAPINGTYLPFYKQYAPTGSTMDSRLSYQYDNYCNVIEIIKDNTEKVVYLWGYNSLYPVAKIEGASYNEVLGYVSESEIESLANNTTTVPTALATIRAQLANSGFLVTTYTYDSLVGMTSQTLPNGQTTTYVYDTSGRLTQVLDNNGNILQKYTYHYQP
ncbi:MAG: RHS repeat protein [Bacteroidaceae bacterium]|nr:RHS repeat protein [Bacteroidaceae bacterium]